MIDSGPSVEFLICSRAQRPHTPVQGDEPAAMGRRRAKAGRRWVQLGIVNGCRRSIACVTWRAPIWSASPPTSPQEECVRVSVCVCVCVCVCVWRVIGLMRWLQLQWVRPPSHAQLR